MINYLIKNLFFITLLLNITSCSSLNKKELTNNNSIIENFEMEQKNQYSQNIVKISSPLAIIESNKTLVKIDKSTIEVTSTSGSSITMLSDYAQLDNDKNLINASGNIDISFSSPDLAYLTANYLIWDMNSNKITINDNVNLYKNNSRVLSNNAIYDLKADTIDFINLKEYQIYSEEDSNNYIVNIVADYAKYDNNKKSLIFSSISGQVDTSIEFFK